MICLTSLGEEDIHFSCWDCRVSGTIRLECAGHSTLPSIQIYFLQSCCLMYNFVIYYLEYSLSLSIILYKHISTSSLEKKSNHPFHVELHYKKSFQKVNWRDKVLWPNFHKVREICQRSENLLHKSLLLFNLLPFVLKASIFWTIRFDLVAPLFCTRKTRAHILN